MKSVGKLLLMSAGFMLFIGIVLFVTFKVIGINYIDGMIEVNQFLEQKKWVFIAFRVSLLIMIFWQWDTFTQWLSRVFKLEQEKIVLIKSARWRIFGWFVFFELVINQNLMNYLLN